MLHQPGGASTDPRRLGLNAYFWATLAAQIVGWESSNSCSKPASVLHARNARNVVNRADFARDEQAARARSITHLHATLNILGELGSHATDDHRDGLELGRINRRFVSNLGAAHSAREVNLGSLIIDP